MARPMWEQPASPGNLDPTFMYRPRRNDHLFLHKKEHTSVHSSATNDTQRGRKQPRVQQVSEQNLGGSSDGASLSCKGSSDSPLDVKGP